MKIKSVACLLVIIFSLPMCLSAQTLRIMTYNVRNAKGMDKITDYERIANVIRSANPDVVALQELDSNTNRSGNKYVLKEIASRCGYHYFYSPAIEFDGGKYGVGVLSKEDPVKITHVHLPGTEEKRILQVVEFKRYVVFATHLSLTEADCDASMNIINEQLKKTARTVFLAGDFNTIPNTNAISLLKKANWRLLSGESFTFPADNPARCIDYIFTRDYNKYKTSWVRVIPDSIASDHRPVVVELTKARVKNTQ